MTSLKAFHGVAAVRLLLFLAGVQAAAQTTITNCTESALRSALAQGGTVSFGCDGVITLADTLSVTNDTVLDAGAHQVVISGSNATRVFYVKPDIGFTAINLTVANGLSTNGGGIYNDGGNLIVQNCAFCTNSAQGLAGGRDGCGGAIYNAGHLQVIRCAFSGNSASGGVGEDNAPPLGVGGLGGAAKGAAICNLGVLAVDSSLFAYNAAAGGSGGKGVGGEMVYNQAPPPGMPGGSGGSARGAGVFNGGTAALVNCTFAHNQGTGGPGGNGGGGGVDFQGSFPFEVSGAGGAGGNGGDGSGALEDATGLCYLTNCTIAFNSGGGGTGGTGGGGAPFGSDGASGQAAGGIRALACQLINTLLATNNPGENFSGTNVDLGHNLSSDASCGFTNIGSLNNSDPRLGPLANNGGPTLTMALLPGSPAIGAGDGASAPPTDQRGYPRPNGAGVDIGAYQYEPGAPVIFALPESQTVCLYSTVQLSASANGLLPLFYQWFLNTTNLVASGAGSNTLQLSDLQLWQAGAYSVVVTNAFGSATSPPALLTLSLTPPTLVTSPTSQAAWTGTSVSFQAAAAGCSPLAYQWFLNGTNALPGATDPTLTLTNVQPAQAGGYSVLVTNTLGAVTSPVAMLTVTPPTVTNSTETALRAAMAVGGTVVFASSGTITLVDTVEIARDTVLNGTGRAVTINVGNAVRVFYVDTNVHFTMINLTIADGRSDYGAGIYNNGGNLVLERCQLNGNVAAGAAGASSGTAGSAGGGAIYNGGTLTANLCAFSYNSANGGLGAPGSPWPVPNNSPGAPGQGGALFNDGVAVISGTSFDSNTAAGGGGGEGAGSGYVGAIREYPAAGAGGADGSGGAIYNSSSLTLLNSTCASNTVSGGPGGQGGSAEIDPYGYYDSSGASGGPGGSGYGGALYNGGVLLIGGSTFEGNFSCGGSGGAGGVGLSGGDGNSGGSGDGGAVYNSGTASLANSTITGNLSAGAAGGPGSNGSEELGGNGGGGGSGIGGGISGACTLTNCTLVSNFAVAGLGNVGGQGFVPNPPGPPQTVTAPGGGSGSATGVSSEGATLANCLLAANSPPDSPASGTIDSRHNLFMAATAGVVGPLANNGGPTLTMALLPGSPAIDAADTVIAPPTDQRGFPRPFGAAADIGAFEYGSWPLLSINRSQPGTCLIQVQGASGQSCRLLTSTTFTNWVPVATNSTGEDGTVSFQINPGTDQERFYRVLSP